MALSAFSSGGGGVGHDGSHHNMSSLCLYIMSGLDLANFESSSLRMTISHASSLQGFRPVTVYRCRTAPQK